MPSVVQGNTLTCRKYVRNAKRGVSGEHRKSTFKYGASLAWRPRRATQKILGMPSMVCEESAVGALSEKKYRGYQTWCVREA
eukprot:1161601-Pelagomonas_calceolata.AAC.19